MARHGIKLLVTVALTAALVLGAVAAGAAEPGGQAGSGTAAWKLQAGKARGLVALTQEGDQFALSFQFLGLKADHRYRLLGHASGCDAATGRIFQRSFTTDGNGTAWDPVMFSGSAGAVNSVRLRDLATGEVVLCTAGPTIPLSTNTDPIKVDVTESGVRGLVVVSQGSNLRVLGTMTGLDADSAHRLIERQDACTTSGPLLFKIGFSTNAAGGVLFDRQSPLPASGDPLAGASLRLRSVPDGSQVFCRPFPTP
jgi:hypothetical protein